MSVAMSSRTPLPINQASCFPATRPPPGPGIERRSYIVEGVSLDMARRDCDDPNCDHVSSTGTLLCGFQFAPRLCSGSVRPLDGAGTLAARCASGGGPAVPAR